LVLGVRHLRWVLKFAKYHIFINVTYFIDIMKECEIKHRYHLKKYINKKKVGAIYMDDNCEWKIYTYLVLGSKISG
jgi:hypothetical protein